MKKFAWRILVTIAGAGLSALAIAYSEQSFADDRLIGHWPLSKDATDQSPNGYHGKIHGDVKFGKAAESDKSSAVFNGRDSWIEIPADVSEQLKLGATISLDVYVSPDRGDVAGDLLSMYDATSRSGIQLSVKDNAITTSHANSGQLVFGIDHNRASDWIDCGRPGNALLAFGLAVHDGSLYAGTCEPEAGRTGHVYRYQPATASQGKDEWIDAGSPDGSNSVTALAGFDGHLYAATGKYRVAGSALPESENHTPGGRVFRYGGGTTWIDCGQLPNTEAVGGLIVFRGRLYASSLYKPAGFFRYEGGTTWTSCGTPGEKRVVALGVYNGYLYATSYDGGFVYRFDGSQWEDCGQLGENTQTYSFAVYQGRLYVGTWPSGRVYLFEEPGRWTDTGRLGEELEVMGMLVQNGRLIAGTLPLAEVYSFEGAAGWTKLTRLDHTPDVKYRRAWTMAEYSGRAYCSTLPSGHIYSFAAGVTAQSNRSLSSGWHHVAAVREPDRLKLYVDGRLTSESSVFESSDYPMTAVGPLRIGFGQTDYFLGSMREVRLYGSSLSESEILKLSQE
ncbi:MAG: hypothetical protein JNL58_21680 [Planctomyces sp.]|nr:hypothetical protein [Planctomyces sp.]